MNRIHTIQALVASATLLLAASCGQGRDGAQEEPVGAAPSLVVSEVGASPEFPDARLGIGSVTATRQGTDSVKVHFSFTVTNYELTAQTADGDSKRCNNSADGQHIHFILDNRPYKALYKPENEVTLPVNSEHYLMAFLSRSYHESLKNPGAALVYHFRIDEKGNLQQLEEPQTPMIFYSRPKGDYLGKDTENVLFDFYVWNAGLSEDGYRVKAEITTEGGLDTSFMITEWKSWFLQQLPMGKANINITLVDKDNNPVQGPETSAGGSFRLASDEPMQ
jgi:hypothetical protein